MRVPKLEFAMSESAVRRKSAVALVEKLALHCLVVAIRLAVEELLLLADFVNVLIWKGLKVILF